MDTDIKRFLLVYVVPICVLSLIVSVVAPPIVSVAILTMLCLSALVVIGIAFLLDYMDGRGLGN